VRIVVALAKRLTQDGSELCVKNARMPG